MYDVSQAVRLRGAASYYFMHIMCQDIDESMGRLTTWHLPGGPVGSSSKWAPTPTLYVEASQMKSIVGHFIRGAECLMGGGCSGGRHC